MKPHQPALLMVLVLLMTGFSEGLGQLNEDSEIEFIYKQRNVAIEPPFP
jgi:hypothetical protein